MTLLRPMWYYGIQLWGSAKPSNTRTIQAFQSICLRLISGALWYITNESLHKDICIPILNILAKITYKKTHLTFSTHSNPIITQLSSNQIPGNPPRRLKRS
uniref:Putative RNA-directed DNA polymerase n=1 Tax=Schizaphis graminum TaxID=13262 RepID=A0A2S2PDV4_SCHGA